MRLRFGNLELEPWTLLIALLPVAAALLSSTLVLRYGSPDPTGIVSATPDIHLEAAARLRMLATWYVLTTLGAGCILFFFVRILSFTRKSFLWLLGAYLVLVVLGVFIVHQNDGQARAENGLGAGTICAALGAPAAPAQREPTAILQAKRQVGLPAGHPDSACPGTQKYAWMWQLNDAQRYLILFFMPALALGGISSLATNGDARAQAGHLKTCLYLSAALLVCGLLFLSALLRWPGAALRGDLAASYQGHVDAYLLYWGASYSVLIAAYYVPVAARLSATIGATMAVATRETEEGGTDLLGIVDILKVAAAVFAPVITALIGNLVEL